MSVKTNFVSGVESVKTGKNILLLQIIKKIFPRSTETKLLEDTFLRSDVSDYSCTLVWQFNKAF